MKKYEQIMVNNDIKETYDDLMQCIDRFGVRKVAKLRACKAEVYETYGYTYLKSYDTIVAAIGHDDNICYDFLRLVYGYTSTSAQHISKFMHDYYSHGKKTYYPV